VKVVHEHTDQSRRRLSAVVTTQNAIYRCEELEDDVFFYPSGGKITTWCGLVRSCPQVGSTRGLGLVVGRKNFQKFRYSLYTVVKKTGLLPYFQINSTNIGQYQEFLVQ